MAEDVPDWPAKERTLIFEPEPPLVEGPADADCRAVVIVPARNEESSLRTSLDALAAQVDLRGRPLRPSSYEVILLLNNCTDASAEVAEAWKSAHPTVRLHIAERTLPPDRAHVGVARRLLMDTAWARLRGRIASGLPCGILSTDSDTSVAPDWIAQNLRALERGADAVGGVIELKPGELDRLPEGARKSYLNDRTFRLLRAELEDLLDPQAGDPFPRHLEHFGASLACTPEAYALAGGMPAVSRLEDMAFVDSLYRMDARLRHEPAVRVFTSARFEGRASVGLSWQLRTWQADREAGEPHTVESAAWLAHRFRSLRLLREVHRQRGTDVRSFDGHWQRRVLQAMAEPCSTGEFLGRMDCNAWIDETFAGTLREEEIGKVCRDLRLAIAQERSKLRLAEAPPPTRVATGPTGTAQLDAH